MKPEKKTVHSFDGKVAYEYWFLNGKLHREDGPACIHYDRDERVHLVQWFQNHQLHRPDGPAYILYYPDGSVRITRWFIEGARLDRI